MPTIAIIQARTGSSRLPTKVLRDIAGKTMLERVVLRAQRAKHVDQVVVATTTEPADEAIVRECDRIGVAHHRGSQDDVLDRYYGAAKKFGADTVVRITSDCPLLDPAVTDAVVALFREKNADYASNSLTLTFPRGVDTEAMRMSALTTAWEKGKEAYERVHVTPYIYQHPAEFKLVGLESDVDYSAHRWCVDTEDDLKLVQTIYARLGANEYASWKDVLAVFEREPALAEINRHVRQKELKEG